MKIEEAIKYLDNLVWKGYSGWGTNAATATKLGIEALKREQRSRNIQTVWEIRKLPGETEE